MLVDYLPILLQIQKLEKLKKIANHNKYVTNNDFNIFSGGKIDKRLKQTKLKSINHLNTVKQSSVKNEEDRKITNN